MRFSQKVVLSLLIAFVLTGAFAIFAYTGLFRVLETDFFSERVKIDQGLRLERIAEGVVVWNDDNLSRFDSLVRDRNFQAIYSVTQRVEEIQFRARSMDALGDRLMGFLGLRVVDVDGRIQYSSFADDIAGEQTGVRRLYRNWDQLDGFFPLPDLGDESDAKIIYDGENQHIIYLLPSLDRSFVVRGWMIVSMSPLGLVDNLASGSLIAPGGGVRVVSGRGVIVDIRPEQGASVRDATDRLWPSGEYPEEFALLANAGGERFWLVSKVAVDSTWVGKLIPGRLLGFSATVQILILSTIYITIFLIVFFILNLRHDRTEVLRRRVNRLQVNLLRDWLEHHEGRKLRLSDLESRRSEVRTELRSGLGLLQGGMSDKVNGIIDEGWTRIIEILAEKEITYDGGSSSDSVTEAPPPIDMKQLEEMITRAVAEAKFVVPPDLLKNISVEQKSALGPSSPGQPIPVEVEELDEFDAAETVEELGDSVEVEELDESDAAEAVEELGDSMEVEELDEFDAAETVEELGDSVEVEELDESDAAEAVEEVGDSVEAEELNASDAAEAVEATLDLVESVKVEEVEESTDKLDGLEQTDEIQPLGGPQDHEDALEVLPVVLSDDSRELIEIDKIDQDRLYMFDKNFEKSGQEAGDIEILDDQEDGLEEVGELEALEEIGELPAREIDSDDSGEVLDGTVQFIDLSELLSQSKGSDGNISVGTGKHQDDETSMESLVMTRATGILPGMDSSDESLFEEESAVLTWSEDGLDYDRFLRGFKKGATGIYKSLMSLSKQYKAICAVLMVGSRKGLETDYAVGLDDDSANYLSVTRNEEVWSEWFSERKIVYVPVLSSSMYAEKTRHNGYRYIRSALFVPIQYQGSPSCIFFGFREVPQDLIPMLKGPETVE